MRGRVPGAPLSRRAALRLVPVAGAGTSPLHCGNTRPYSAATDCTQIGLLAQSNFVLSVVSTAFTVYLLPSALMTLISSPKAITRFATKVFACVPPPPHETSTPQASSRPAHNATGRIRFAFNFIQYSESIPKNQ